MKLIRQINDLNKAIKGHDKLGFVPTMGSLHNGHESLIKHSQKICKKTLVTIFINPTQFDNKKDYKIYPRNLKKDLILLKRLKVDFVFLPTSKQIYKNKHSAKFTLKKSEKILCAKYRKGHFEGVLDVMNRFVTLITPKYVFMGEKDFQQLFLVKKFIEKKFQTKIYACKTIRIPNKTALSSRNYLLNENDLKITGIIANSLFKLKHKIFKNKNKSTILINILKKELTSNYKVKIEYLEARNLINLKKNIQQKNFKIFIAYYLNKTRLIDNF
jgi:pantoate--beta-alanine ligase